MIVLTKQELKLGLQSPYGCKRIHEGPGFRIPASRFRVPASGFWIINPLDSGFQPSGFWISYQSGFQIPNHCIHLWIPDSGAITATSAKTFLNFEARLLRQFHSHEKNRENMMTMSAARKLKK